ncbi:MAG: DUF2127 domain-containing protein [Microbacteriaceae bacterium]|nr:DUF2127 domain-containing protein [Burkholderiaceae bacterium]
MNSGPTDVRAVLPAQPAPLGTPAAAYAEAVKRDDAARKLLRTIAGFEALKGLVALAAGLGLLGYVHHDLHRAAAALINHVGLQAGSRYPAPLLGQLDRLPSADLGPLMLAVGGYVLLRLTEAYGLWHGRPWGEWLGAVSGALYVPFEVQHLVHRPQIATAAVLAANLAVVGLLVWRLLQRRR